MSMLPCFFVLSLAYFLAQLSKCLAVSINRTIDDTNGDPITGFTPKYSSGWHSDVSGTCPTGTCLIKLDPSQVFEKTLHDTTNEIPGATLPSVTLEFTGTAIYLFCIVPNTVPDVLTVVNLQFTLDNATAGIYQHFQNKSNVIEYSVPVLSLENLANKPHTLVAEAIFGSLFLFDYAIYTFDDTPSTSPASTSAVSATSVIASTQISSISTGSSVHSSATVLHNGNTRHGASVPAIAGGAGAAAVVILALVTTGVLFMKCRMRKRKLARPEAYPPPAYTPQPLQFTSLQPAEVLSKNTIHQSMTEP